MRIAIIISLLCLNIPAIYAQDKNSKEALLLDQAILKVLEKNPQLGAQSFESQAAASRIRQAQQTKPYELKIGFDNFASNSDSNEDKTETSLSLIKVLEPANTIGTRSNLARLENTLLKNTQDATRLDLLAKATQQFIHVAVDQHRLEIARNHLSLIRHTSTIVSQRVSAGKSHIAEQRRLGIELARAEVELEHAEHELLSSRLKLATYWGENNTDFPRIQTNLYNLSPVKALNKLEELLNNNPDLVRFASEKRIAEARLKLAESRRSGNWEVSGGIRHFNSSNDSALMLSLSIPLGTSSRAQAEIEEMDFLSQREPFRYQQQWLKLYSSLYEIYQELQHARTAYNILNKKIIPLARLSASDYEQGYKSGRFSLLELNEAQGTLLNAQLEKVMTAANFHHLKIEIERLTGIDLSIGKQQ